MTDTFHDTLTAEARAREQLEHDVREIGEKLEDIKKWRPLLDDVILTLSAINLSLAPARGTTDRIPGGDALAMLGPYSVGYDEPDDLPHPVQVIREWADKWRDATRTPVTVGKWEGHLAVLQANTAWFVRQDRSGDFRADISALWWRLARLTGNAPDNDLPTMADAEEIQRHAAAVPDQAMLTLREADRFNPGIENRVKRDRNAERDRAKKAKRPPEYRCDPEGSRYLVADLRRHYGFPVVENSANMM